jgi:hypothetical protein
MRTLRRVSWRLVWSGQDVVEEGRRSDTVEVVTRIPRRVAQCEYD